MEKTAHLHPIKRLDQEPRDAVSRELLRVAFGRFLVHDDPSWLTRLVGARDKIIGDRARSLLAEIGHQFPLTTFPDLINRLRTSALDSHADFLEQIVADPYGTPSDTVFEELWAKLVLPHVGIRFQDLALDLFNRRIVSGPDALAEFDRIRELSAQEFYPSAGYDLFEARYVNPPSPRAVKAPSHVEGLLVHGYVNASGPPKVSFKTWFFLALSLHIHTGRDFLGRKVLKANCAWIQLDMAEADFQHYADRVAQGMGIPENPLPYFCSGKIDLMDRRQWVSLESQLQRLGTQILFIDSSRAAASVKENDSDEVRQLVRGLFCARLRDKLGITIVLIAHTPKGAAGARGSGEWVGAADSEWRFEVSEGGSAVTIHGTGRHPPFQISFELVDLGNGSCAIQEVAQKDVEQRRAVSTERIEAAFQILSGNAAGISQNKLLEGMTARDLGIKRSKAPLLVKALMEAHPDVGLRTETRGKKGKATFSVLYLIADPGGSPESGNHVPTTSMQAIGGESLKVVPTSGTTSGTTSKQGFGSPEVVPGSPPYRGEPPSREPPPGGTGKDRDGSYPPRQKEPPEPRPGVDPEEEAEWMQ